MAGVFLLGTMSLRLLSLLSSRISSHSCFCLETRSHLRAHTDRELVSERDPAASSSEYPGLQSLLSCLMPNHLRNVLSPVWSTPARQKQEAGSGRRWGGLCCSGRDSEGQFPDPLLGLSITSEEFLVKI